MEKVKRGLSAGRVQTVAVRLIVEKEREIEAFSPQEYWEITAELEKDKEKFVAKLLEIEGKKPRSKIKTRQKRLSQILKNLIILF